MSILMIEGWARRDPALYVGPAVLQSSLVSSQIGAIATKTPVAVSGRERERLSALYDERVRVVQPVRATEGLSLNLTV